MANRNSLGANQRKGLVQRIKTLRKRTLFSLAAVVFVASGGYFEASKIQPMIINYHDQGQDEFYQEIESKNKKGLLFFYTDYCYPCSRMNDFFMKNPETVALVNQEYIPYKLDGFERGDGKILREKYKIDKFPTVLVLDEFGKELSRISKPLSATEVTEHLRGYVEVNDTFNRVSDVESVPELTSSQFSLTLNSFESYEEARSAALLKAEMWEKEIWIEKAELGDFYLFLGLFNQESDARLAENYLESWEGLTSTIRPLNRNPQSY